MKKVLVFLFIGIFLISLVYAQGEKTWNEVKLGSCIELSQTCGNCTYVNISAIIYPNKTSYALFEETTMTKSGTYYNYTFCDIQTIGEYIVSGHGDPEGKLEIWRGNFEVTLTGKKESSVFDNPISIFLLVLAFLFLVIGIKLEMEWLGFIGGTFFMLGGIYVFIYGFNYLQNIYTQGIGLSLSFIGLAIALIAIYEWLSKFDSKSEN